MNIFNTLDHNGSKLLLVMLWINIYVMISTVLSEWLSAWIRYQNIVVLVVYARGH